MSEAKHPIRSVDRTLDIIEIVQAEDGAGVSEIAERVDIGKSAVHNHLSTLVEREYLVNEGGEYHIGLSFLGLGVNARNRTSIQEIAQPKIENLAEETGELVNLLVERGGKGIYLYQARGENSVEVNSYEGMEVYLHSTALGKAILAFRPREEVERILDDHGLPARTERTISTEEELYDNLEEIRDKQYAVDNEERLTGLCCVAAPIVDEDDYSIGAVSISCPIHRVNDERLHEGLPDAALRTANVIELEHNYS